MIPYQLPIIINAIDYKLINSHIFFEDAHAKRTGYPDKDANQDYTLLTASRNETHINACFKRLRYTCDDDQDYRLTVCLH